MSRLFTSTSCSSSATTASDASLASAYCSGVEVGTSSPVRPRPSAARSGSGTPSSSQMTVNGSGNAKRATRSTRLSAPSAAMSSSRSSTIVWIRGRSPSMRRGEKALETSRRSRVWSGGSTVSMCRAKAGPGRPSDTTAASASEGGVHVLRQPRVVERGAGLVVADDEPRVVAVDERHRVDRAAPAHVGEQGERVVAVVRPPRRQRRRHVVLNHRQTISQLRHVPRRVIRPPFWAAFGPIPVVGGLRSGIPSVGRPDWRIGTEVTLTRPRLTLRRWAGSPGRGAFASCSMPC